MADIFSSMFSTWYSLSSYNACAHEEDPYRGSCGDPLQWKYSFSDAEPAMTDVKPQHYYDFRSILVMLCNTRNSATHNWQNYDMEMAFVVNWISLWS